MCVELVRRPQAVRSGDSKWCAPSAHAFPKRYFFAAPALFMAGSAQDVVVEPPFLHDHFVGAVLVQDPEGVEQDRTELAALGDDGALIEVAEALERPAAAISRCSLS